MAFLPFILEIQWCLIYCFFILWFLISSHTFNCFTIWIFMARYLWNCLFHEDATCLAWGDSRVPLKVLTYQMVWQEGAQSSYFPIVFSSGKPFPWDEIISSFCGLSEAWKDLDVWKCLGTSMLWSSYQPGME